MNHETHAFTDPLRQACEAFITSQGVYYYSTELSCKVTLTQLLVFMKAQRAAEARVCSELCSQHHARDHWYITKLRDKIEQRAKELEER